MNEIDENFRTFLSAFLFFFIEWLPFHVHQKCLFDFTAALPFQFDTATRCVYNFKCVYFRTKVNVSAILPFDILGILFKHQITHSHWWYQSIECAAMLYIFTTFLLRRRGDGSRVAPFGVVKYFCTYSQAINLFVLHWVSNQNCVIWMSGVQQTVW